MQKASSPDQDSEGKWGEREISHRPNGYTPSTPGGATSPQRLPGFRFAVLDAGVAAALGLVGVVDVLVIGPVDRLLEDGLRVVHVELAAELPLVVGDGAAVGPAAGLGEVELVVVDDFVAHVAPIALATAVLLRLLGVGVDKARLAEELGDDLRARDAFEDGLVVDAVDLVRASHLDGIVVMGV